MIFNIPSGEQLTLILVEIYQRFAIRKRYKRKNANISQFIFFSFNNASEHWLVSAAALRSHCAACCRESKSL